VFQPPGMHSAKKCRHTEHIANLQELMLIRKQQKKLTGYCQENSSDKENAESVKCIDNKTLEQFRKHKLSPEQSGKSHYPL
jgi:hypothetical protein